jgi:hypothetical protein
MAVLFQNAGEQLGAAKAGLAQTLFKGALTLYDKIDQAEQTSQFNVGQTQLTNAMNQFDYQRSTKGAADFLQWQDQNTKAMDEAWATIEKTIPNQGAKNQLNDWWQGQKESRSRRIESDTINARINQLGGQYEDLRKRTITDSTLDVDSKVAKLTGLANQYTEMGVIPAQSAQDHLFADAHALYKNGNLSAIQKKMEAEGTQAGFDWGNDPDSDYGQMLTPEQRAQNAEAAKRSRQSSLTLQKENAQNAADANVTTVTSWIAENKIPEDAIARINGTAQKPEDNLKFPSVMDGPDAVYSGEKQQQAAMKLLEARTKFDPVTAFEVRWDHADKQDAATRDALTKEFDSVQGITSVQKSRLKSYLSVGRGQKPTQEDEDAVLAQEYEDVQLRKVDISDAGIIADITKNVWNDEKASFGAKQRFSQFIAAKQKQEQSDPSMKALYDSYKAPPGATPEEVEIARKMGLYGVEYFEKHPEVTNPKDRENIMNGLHSYFSDAYIQDSIVKLAGGLPGAARAIASWFGADPEREHIADLVQAGDLQLASAAGDTVAEQQYGAFTQALGREATAKFPGSQPLAITPRTKGQQKGKQPLYRTLSSDQKTVYELWKIGGNISWYSLPASKAKGYVDIGDKGSDWSQVK